jgi:Cdc6-like AAA superfamily ATPase
MIRTKANVEKIWSKLDKTEHLEILNWITPIDYGPQQTDYIERRQDGTGQWLLDSAQYQTWLNISKQTLFCPGNPGTGKTILTSVVIQELNARYFSDVAIGIAYIYFNFRQQDKQNVNDLLASLLKQLAESQPSLPKSVKDLHNQHKTKRTRPSTKEISDTLQAVATLYSRVFIVVDALDECQVSNSYCLKFLSEIFSLQTKSVINFFATSRFIPEITEKFNESLQLEIRASDQDVERYLHNHILQLPKCVLNSLGLQEEIKDRILKAVDGMYVSPKSLNE